MSKLNSGQKQRQEVLKGIIRDLHAGVDVEEIKTRFGDLLDQVGPTEIGELEQSLIEEGLAVEEIQKLCDVHVAVFKESLEKQRAAASSFSEIDSNPLAELERENKAILDAVKKIGKIVQQIKAAEGGADISASVRSWDSEHQRLGLIDSHYLKKENIIFPYLERRGISGPPSVMWGIHDEIRASYKEITHLIAAISDNRSSPAVVEKIENLVLPALEAVGEMVYKEAKILFPMCRDTFTAEEWEEIKEQFKNPYTAVRSGKGKRCEAAGNQGGINLDIGILSAEQINLIFTHLPVDITFVDENDEVRFFSLGPERLFERTGAIIGRKVQLCHPPASINIVERILDDFKSGRRDSADFWINMKGQMIYIRYFAVRDQEGVYRGTLEVTQNVTEIQGLTGEKRIYDYAQ